jgi:hypothetical protein
LEIPQDGQLAFLKTLIAEGLECSSARGKPGQSQSNVINPRMMVFEKSLISLAFR